MRRSGQKNRTVLQDRTAATPLRASDELDPAGYDILRIRIRKAEYRPFSPRRVGWAGIRPPSGSKAQPHQGVRNRRVDGPIERRIGTRLGMSGGDDERIGHLVMVPDRPTP